MKTASAKAKGRKLQNQMKQVILEQFKQLEEDDVQVAIMGQSGTDIKLSPLARKLFPYSVEAKNVEKLNIWSAISQAEYNTKEGTSTLVVFSRNRMPEPYVALKLSDFMKLTAGAIHETNNPTTNNS